MRQQGGNQSIARRRERTAQPDCMIVSFEGMLHRIPWDNQKPCSELSVLFFNSYELNEPQMELLCTESNKISKFERKVANY